MIFNNKALNYALAFAICIALFLLLYWRYSIFRDDNQTLTIFHSAIFQVALWQKVIILFLLFVSFMFYVETSRVTLDPQTETEVLFLGSQTGIWTNKKGGVYFFPFHRFGLFTLYEGVEINTEKKMVRMIFYAPDLTGKALHCSLLANWSITNPARYEVNPAEDMPTNIKFALAGAVLRITATRTFLTQVVTDNLVPLIRADHVFVTQCEEYGINCNNIVLLITSGNPKADDLNSIIRTLSAQIKADNPGISASDLSKEALVQMGIIKAMQIDGADAIATPVFVNT